MLRWCVLGLVLLASCGGSGEDGSGSGGPVPRGARVLGIHVGAAEDGSYDAAIALAKSFGTEAVPLLFTWTMIEPAPLTYDATLPSIANVYYPAVGLRLSLAIAPINTNVIERPSDLAGLAWDDPALIARFNAMQDFLFSEIPDVVLESYAIGNEVDATLVTAADYAAYKAFYEAAKAHAKSLRSGLRVGVIAEWGGLTGAAGALLASLNATSDFVGATYYGIGAGFMVKPTSAVHADFAALFAMYPSTPVYMIECGYPASATLGSSEALQSDFVREVFLVWDENASRMPVVYFFKQTDWSAAEVDSIAAYYGGSGSAAFKEYLATLGFRTWAGSGTDKPAFTTLKSESAARGW